MGFRRVIFTDAAFRVGADGVDEKVDALEKAVEGFSGKAGGAGGIAIT